MLTVDWIFLGPHAGDVLGACLMRLLGDSPLHPSQLPIIEIQSNQKSTKALKLIL